MYMDRIKLFAKNGKELETLIQTIKIYSHDTGMEFGKEKCAMLIMENGKRQRTEGKELANQEKIRTTGETENYKYLGISEANTFKEYRWRTRKLIEIKLCSGNLIKRINTRAVTSVRYSGPLLKWIREELRKMDQRKRKLMTMQKAWHPIDDIDKLYVSRKEGRRGLTSIEDSVDASIKRFHDYIQWLLTALIT